MKNYARHLVDVYERKNDILLSGYDGSPLDRFVDDDKKNWIEDFTKEPPHIEGKPDEDSHFYKCFVKEYRVAIGIITEEILSDAELGTISSSVSRNTACIPPHSGV
jgi:hypothetical protein